MGVGGKGAWSVDRGVGVKVDIWEGKKGGQGWDENVETDFM